VTTFIAMRRDPHPKWGETLADYFYRLHGRTLGRAILFEIDMESGDLREHREPDAPRRLTSM
jgi:hypothetical protein